MTVKAWLEGRPGDLATLARHFTGDPAVRLDEPEDYYLTSAAFGPLWSEVSDLRATAAAVLTKLNGVARVLDLGFRPVRLKERYSDSEGGGSVVCITGAIEVSAAFAVATISINGVPQKPAPSAAPGFAQLADQHPDVAEVFELLADADELDWYTLYKVYEIIRHNVGGSNNGRAKQILVSKGWVTEQEIDVFAESACSEEISGKAARHARAPRRSANSVTLAEGRAFIAHLTHCWLSSL